MRTTILVFALLNSSAQIVVFHDQRVQSLPKVAGTRTAGPPLQYIDKRPRWERRRTWDTYESRLQVMMILLLGLGLVLASLRFPSEAAAAAVLLVTQATLAFAILAVVYRAGEGRAFWLGFALFGWGYMALTWESWLGQSADRPEMLTSIALDHLGAWFHRTRARRRLCGRSADRPAAPRRTVSSWPSSRSRSRCRLPRKRPSKTCSSTSSRRPPAPPTRGIPIYVDPVGLQEADKTMTSPVTHMDLDGVPLRVTLGLLLKQLDLEYVVRDGMLKIGKASTVSSAAPFRRMGHCYWALLAAFCGGCAGRTLHNTRTRETVAPGR